MMKTIFKLTPVAGALACLAATSAMVHAADNAAVDTGLRFAPIVVTVVQTPSVSPTALRSNPKQAAQPIPASDGAAYLKTIMGFNGIQSGGTNGDVTFRGMFGSRIKILVDGAENLGACPNRMDAPTSYIAPESFDRIEVIKGPQTVRSAMGSAASVNFERATPTFSVEQPYQGEISTVFGSFGRMDQNIQLAAGKARGYARINANRSIADSYQDGNGQTVPSAWEKWNTDLALGWTPTAATLLELHGGKSDGNALYGGRSMDGAQFARESIGLKFKQNINADKLKNLTAQVDYSDNDHVMDNFSLRPFVATAMMKTPMAMDVARQTLNSRINIDYVLGQAQLGSGIDSQISTHSGRMGMGDGNSYQNMPYTEDARFESYGAFTDLRYPIAQNGTSLVAGVRIDKNTVKDLRAASASSNFNLQRDNQALGGFLRLENNTLPSRWSLGVGHVERMPDYWELFTPVHGNSGSSNTFNGVNPEKTTQLDIGYRYREGALSTNMTAYYGKVQDFILINYHHHASAMADMGHDMTSITPSAKNVAATLTGIEAGIGYALNPAFKVDANIAYAWGRNDSSHTPLPQIAPLEARFNLQYQHDNYSVGTLLRSVARQNRIAEHQGNIVGYDMGESAGFSTLSLNTTYRFNAGLQWSVGIDNVLDKTYTEHLNKAGSSNFGYVTDEQLNNPGRNYWTRLSVKF